MRTKTMSRVALQIFPTMMLAPTKALGLAAAVSVGLSAGVCVAQEADQNPGQATAETAPSATPSGPQGSFFPHPPMGGFPPLGFDPMTGTVDPNAMSGDAYNPSGNNRTNVGVRGHTSGDTQVDVQVRGRIGIGGGGHGGGQGLGSPGWGGYYGPGAPFKNGYGAPYGTPFDAGATAPQYAPQDPKAEGDESSNTEQSAPSAQAPAPQAAAPQRPSSYTVRPAFPQPFSWAPSGMPVPGLSVGPGAGAYTQPQEQASAPRADAVQPKQPDWVDDRRAEAEKRRLEAEKRFTEMQYNNFYAGRGYGQPYGQPYGQGYGAPYGVPYGAPYGYAPQQQAPVLQPQAAPKSEEKTE